MLKMIPKDIRQCNNKKNKNQMLERRRQNKKKQGGLHSRENGWWRHTQIKTLALPLTIWETLGMLINLNASTAPPVKFI